MKYELLNCLKNNYEEYISNSSLKVIYSPDKKSSLLLNIIYFKDFYANKVKESFKLEKLSYIGKLKVYNDVFQTLGVYLYDHLELQLEDYQFINSKVFSLINDYKKNLKLTLNSNDRLTAIKILSSLDELDKLTSFIESNYIFKKI